MNNNECFQASEFPHPPKINVHRCAWSLMINQEGRSLNEDAYRLKGNKTRSSVAHSSFRSLDTDRQTVPGNRGFVISDPTIDLPSPESSLQQQLILNVYDVKLSDKSGSRLTPTLLSVLDCPLDISTLAAT
ncbi:hypothetical protein UY3_06828 [Chelonia mydas]|uniref:Uncharacterized protein n=1 Tax=Chelonia mydas TaxID=8469 RepID=M7BJS3_CHEMY|nr:hypothetical protein UY3_06828 [Chelonia mydas]